MRAVRVTCNLAASIMACSVASHAPAQDLPPLGAPPPSAAPEVLSEDVDVLLDMLAAEEDPGEATRLAREVEERWSHSGSAAMDLLLRRGKDAIELEELDRAVVHLTALTDHAPDFAEGWVARATAFFLQERWGLALSDLEQALILEPRHYGALTGLCVLMEQIDETELALRACRASLEVHPNQEEIGEFVERLEAATGGRTL